MCRAVCVPRKDLSANTAPLSRVNSRIVQACMGQAGFPGQDAEHRRG